MYFSNDRRRTRYEDHDWTCIKCRESNFGRNTKCRKCDSVKSKRGDWICSNCGDLVFASKSACSKCHTAKSGLPYQFSSSFGSSDWTCPTCQFLIYGKKDSCSKCHFKRSDLVVQQPPIETIKVVPEPPGHMEPVVSTDQSCVICLDAPRCFVLTTCGHLCFCNTCGYATNKCPLCRKSYNPDKDLLKIYA